MGNVDRRWWINGVMALAVAGLTVVFVPWYLLFLLPYDLRSGFLGQFDMALAILCLLFLLGGIAAALLKLMASYEREAARIQAVGGVANGMVAIDWPLHVPRDEPLPPVVTVEWPNTLRIRILLLVGTMVVIAFFAGMIVMFCAWLLDYVLRLSSVDLGWLHQFVISLSGGRRTQAPVAYPPLTPLPFLGLFAFMPITMALHWIISRVPTLARISADHAGLTADTRWGRHIHMPWHAVRLIELRGVLLQDARPSGSNRHVREYAIITEVRDEHRVIMWAVSPRESRERLRQFDQLMAATVQLSGRRARTFGLESPQRSVGGRLDLIADQLKAAGVVPAGVVVPGLVYGLFEPDAHIVLVITGLMGIFGVWFVVRMGKPKVQSSASISMVAHASSSAELEPSWEYDPQALYEMMVGSYQLFRLTRGMGIALGLGSQLALESSLHLISSSSIGLTCGRVRSWRWSGSSSSWSRGGRAIPS
jgi:hypothetical protein